MIILEGKYAKCKVFTDQELEPAAMTQLNYILNCEAFAGAFSSADIRVMPDVHACVGAVVGFTCPILEVAIPAIIGVDIGCRVSSYCLEWQGGINYTPERLLELDSWIRKRIPLGPVVNQTVANDLLDYVDQDWLDDFVEVAKETGQDPDRVLKSLGTLGSGNHFIEFGKSKQSGYWLTVHSGSRGFGFGIANHHCKIAKSKMHVEGGIEWLEGPDADTYYRHTRVAQGFAAINHKLMMARILPFFGIGPGDWRKFWDCRVESIHNYINFGDKIIRKGAISAHYGERVVIPWNMKDGLIIGRGLGNLDWNESAPHGAGRSMPVGLANRSLSVERFQEVMNTAGVWSSSVGKDTLSESPFAYKDPQTILSNLKETVRVEDTVVPIYNLKGGRIQRRK